MTTSSPVPYTGWRVRLTWKSTKKFNFGSERQALHFPRWPEPVSGRALPRGAGRGRAPAVPREAALPPRRPGFLRRR